jgi:hypothetical protein
VKVTVQEIELAKRFQESRGCGDQSGPAVWGGGLLTISQQEKGKLAASFHVSIWLTSKVYSADRERDSAIIFWSSPYPSLSV